ncbi:M14 family metallopeptidase [Pseudogemmatithrix spongiicola]|uniref:M14 family metallopeptidase n=1 Tax=Pseudogemmatithrix spongiicola TaxID=3062599 RepID=A0AA49JWT6_9BACT|nr:M14 family metallopeptidase [Gemmatimonadaceae bacterium 'strain 138']WKW16169.1 M14 family metallopeptidase [Gemmatimonadaceae bacterium 'strain 318']
MRAPILALLLTAAPLAAQMGGGGGGRGAAQAPRDTARRVLTIPGLRDGQSMFPLANYREMQPRQWGVMDFAHYHTTAELNYWMQRWARERPEIVELVQVGTSFGGQPIWQLIVTNKSTGKHTDKPAAFFEGGRHSGEITSSESVLWLAWHVIENYGKDPAITRLLDQSVLYLRLNNNPDGADMYKLTPMANRSSVRPVDNDGDGLLDEDSGEDLDGDGHIRQMRKFVGAGNGTHVIDTMDAKGRLMRQVGQGRGDYMVYPEGIDNDKDGRYNEDGVGGLDLHRNYPYNWRPMEEATGRGQTQFGAGEYPLSEPETRAVFLWQVRHPNISVTNSMDTSVPMHLRGPSTCLERECVFPSDLKLLQHYDSVGNSLTNYGLAGDVYWTYGTRGQPAGQERPTPLFGHGPDFGYFQMGQVWYGDELWNGGREIDYNKDGRIDQYEVLRYNDERFGGRGYQMWTKVMHPDLGEVEVGGADPKFWSQNPPAEDLERWAKNQAMFNLNMAMDLPKLDIPNVEVRRLRGAQRDSATHEVLVRVRNSGRIPTALEQAKRVHIVRPDALTIEGGGLRTVGPRIQEFWVGGFETKTVTVRVIAPAGQTVEANARVTSTRGGIADAPVVIRP